MNLFFIIGQIDGDKNSPFSISVRITSIPSLCLIIIIITFKIIFISKDFSFYFVVLDIDVGSSFALIGYNHLIMSIKFIFD